MSVNFIRCELLLIYEQKNCTPSTGFNRKTILRYMYTFYTS